MTKEEVKVFFIECIRHIDYQQLSDSPPLAAFIAHDPANDHLVHYSSKPVNELEPGLPPKGYVYIGRVTFDRRADSPIDRYGEVLMHKYSYQLAP